MEGHELVFSHCSGRITPTIFLMKRMNVVDSTSREEVKLDKNVCPFGNLRSGKGPKWVCKGMIHRSLHFVIYSGLARASKLNLLGEQSQRRNQGSRITRQS